MFQDATSSQPAVKPSHSRLGLVSIGALVLACGGTCIAQGTGIVIGVLLAQQGYTNAVEAVRSPEYAQYAATAGVVGLCQFAAIPLAFIGLLAGIGGIFEPSRRKEAAIVGAVINGLALLVAIGLLVVGYMVIQPK